MQSIVYTCSLNLSSISFSFRCNESNCEVIKATRLWSFSRWDSRSAFFVFSCSKELSVSWTPGYRSVFQMDLDHWPILDSTSASLWSWLVSEVFSETSNEIVSSWFLSWASVSCLSSSNWDLRRVCSSSNCTWNCALVSEETLMSYWNVKW